MAELPPFGIPGKENRSEADPRDERLREIESRLLVLENEISVLSQSRGTESEEEVKGRNLSTDARDRIVEPLRREVTLLTMEKLKLLQEKEDQSKKL